jgi:hypothetical protein
MTSGTAESLMRPAFAPLSMIGHLSVYPEKPAADRGWPSGEVVRTKMLRSKIYGINSGTYSQEMLDTGEQTVKLRTLFGRDGRKVRTPR